MVIYSIRYDYSYIAKAAADSPGISDSIRYSGRRKVMINPPSGALDAMQEPPCL